MPYEVERGGARFCSVLCARRSPRFGLRERGVNAGERNPAWKGGISKQGGYRYKKRFVAKFPEKVAAHQAVHAAVKAGVLKRLPCEACGRVDGVEGHHDDYTQQLAVVWLCDHDHKLLHRLISLRDRTRNREEGQR